MKLLVGLGNPGLVYEQQRHNLGFMFVDALVKEKNLAPYSERFHCHLTSWLMAGEKVLLAKPQLFMNNSGSVVSELVHYYKLDLDDLFIVHDDLDLQFLDTRYKVGGGNAGHRGLNSIDSYLGKDYHRLRIGIGRPEMKEQVKSYVLQNFSPHQQLQVTSYLLQGAKLAHHLLSGQQKLFLELMKDHLKAINS